MNSQLTLGFDSVPPPPSRKHSREELHSLVNRLQSSSLPWHEEFIIRLILIRELGSSVFIPKEYLR